jgi:ATP-dependent helicase/DNAse subunit B
MDLHGYATKKSLLTKGTALETMDAQIQEWRRVLTNLADEFAAGDARVRPKEYPKTCQYCAQRLVCRLDVAALDADEDEEDEDEDQ